MSRSAPRLRVEVWRYNAGLILFSDDGNGGGTRVFGPKTDPAARTKIGDVWLDAAALATMAEELDQIADGGAT